MKTGTLKYYQDEDVLYFFLKEGSENKNIEAAPGVTVELDEKDNIIGIEILGAAKFIQNYVLKTFSKEINSVDV